MCSKMCAQNTTNEVQAGFDQPVSFPEQKGDNENEVVRISCVFLCSSRVPQEWTRTYSEKGS